MSFNGTKTPTRQQVDPKKQRYHVPMRRSKAGPMEFYLPEDMQAQFRRDMENELNRTVMEWYGLSFVTCQRFKRELGIVKNMAKVKHKQAMHIKRVCEKNGWYDSMRGHAPSPQCREAAAKKRAEGFHPLRRLKEISPRRYKARLRKMSRDRKELIATERRRYNIGLSPVSGLNPVLYAGVQFDRYQVYVRRRARQLGYTVGSRNPELGERSFIYYDDKTERRPMFESNATRRGGFEFRPIALRGKVVEIVLGNQTFME